MKIQVPEVGESVREALLAKWFKKNGDKVQKDEPLCELETDKITLDLNADAEGILTIQVAEGTTVPVGTVIGLIDEKKHESEAVAAQATAAPAPSSVPAAHEELIKGTISSPSVRKEIREAGIDPQNLTGSGKGGRLTHDDLKRPAPAAVSSGNTAATPPVDSGQAAQVAQKAVQQATAVHSENASAYNAGRSEDRKPMSPLRKRISERLLAARQQTAMLTTFNEADLGQIKELREKHKEHFRQRHGAPLGFMPFFIKACVEALKEFPAVNASIDGNDLVYHNYYDIGVAIGGEKGLVVPILRDADKMRLFEMDQSIAAFAEKIKTNKLAISDLEGGTFTISNGGVYGSMLSTPILNPPQSAVLGMHAIQDRPVVRDGQIVIRPMMYLALSYDHRIIDGREAVGFLKRVKEYVEEPEELLLEG